ncbi:protein of unknown function [Kyrpidia spormannii]|uniref:Uncharacterized protein n=1 Tax=Kyrpidia spormannii TaxID=2055160 RepID=A0ACA8ZBB0_9BACL|nr:protein of unknown function [Kyrpidia spormannii]
MLRSRYTFNKSESMISLRTERELEPSGSGPQLSFCLEENVSMARRDFFWKMYRLLSGHTGGIQPTVRRIP